MAVWKLQDIEFKENPRMIVSGILQSFPDLQYRSADALSEMYSHALDLSIEIAHIGQKETKGSERGKLTRYISLAEKRRINLPKTREELLRMLYEEILIEYGCGRLRGFGFCNRFGDPLPGDGERQSCVMFPIEVPKQQGKEERRDIMKRSELVNAAKELNQKLGLKPPIDIKAKADALTQLLKEALELIDPTDTFTEATQAVLDEIKGPVTTDAGYVDEKGEEQTSEVTPSVAEKKKPAEKKATPKKEKADSDGVTSFGHRVNSQSGKIDRILERGEAVSLEEVAKEIDCPAKRVLSHIKHLQKDKSVEIESVKDKYRLVS